MSKTCGRTGLAFGKKEKKRLSKILMEEFRETISFVLSQGYDLLGGGGGDRGRRGGPQKKKNRYQPLIRNQ